MHMIRPEDIQHCSDPGSFARGVKYFNQGRVLSVQVKPDAARAKGFSIFAKVAGSAGQVYEQNVVVQEQRKQHLDIFGECTCPVGYNCKHVVAACLQYNKQHQGPGHDTQEYWRQWLQRFSRPVFFYNPMLDEAEFFAYLLAEDPRHLGVTVTVLQTRPLKRGGFSKGKIQDVANLFYALRRQRCATPEDVRIIELLMPLQHSHYDLISLHGELGYLVLQHMLATQRCFWGEVSEQALQPAADRESRLTWTSLNDGHQRLELTLEPAGLPVPTSPAVYIDPQRNVCGKISGTPFSDEQWQLLDKAPIVAAADVDEFSRALLTALPGVPLQLPSHIQIEELAGSPIPCLYLQRAAVDVESVHCMRLCFDYQGQEIAMWPVAEHAVCKRGEVLITVHRDLPLESAAVKRLQSCGFDLFQGDVESEDLIFLPAGEQPLFAAQAWHEFVQQDLPLLREEGWRIEITAGFDLQVHDVGEWDVLVDDHNDWFDLRFDLEVDGRKLPLLPIVSQLLMHYEPDQLPEQVMVPIGENAYVKLPGERIRSICRVLYELHDGIAPSPEDHLVLQRFEAGRLADLQEILPPEKSWLGGERLLRLGEQLRNFQGIETVAPPVSLQAELRHYQQAGLNWLQFLRTYEFGGILADDMGLGKTVQTLAHLLVEKERGRMDKPCLIVAPTSVIGNWRREARRFAPSLSVLVLQGAGRHQHHDKLTGFDLLLTTYPLVVRDAEVLLAGEYHYLILDEAQYIKNPKSKTAKLVRRISARHRLCLTGTPMENHLGELWAQFDFLMPGFLGKEAEFSRRFRTPIEKHADALRREQLVRKVTPFMLRRTKTEVVAELPPKTEMLRTVALGSKQAALYESIRLAMEKKVRQAIASKGLARSHIMVLDALLKLRQTCCDPGLLSLAEAANVNESAKLEMLMDMLPPLLEEGRRVLLFSQFTRMLGIIEGQLQERGIGYAKLTGQTRDREAVIDRFKEGSVALFLISLKAGGVGLNLTEADTVIHYDPWWNPATENQATDRVYRIGQDKPVFVYKLLTENTVEEKILAMQERKQSLADGIYQGKAAAGEQLFSAEDLTALFAAEN